MNKYLKRLLTRFKDPYFVINIWQNMCILAFLVGIFIGATLTQNYYIEQVNNVFDQAKEQDGCFNDFYYRLTHNDNKSWQVENSPSIVIDDVPDKTSEPK